MSAKAAAAAAAAAGQGNEWIPSCKVWDLVGGHERSHPSIFNLQRKYFPTAAAAIIQHKFINPLLYLPTKK